MEHAVLNIGNKDLFFWINQQKFNGNAACECSIAEPTSYLPSLLKLSEKLKISNI